MCLLALGLNIPEPLKEWRLAKTAYLQQPIRRRERRKGGVFHVVRDHFLPYRVTPVIPTNIGFFFLENKQRSFTINLLHNFLVIDRPPITRIISKKTFVTNDRKQALLPIVTAQAIHRALSGTHNAFRSRSCFQHCDTFVATGPFSFTRMSLFPFPQRDGALV